MTNKNNKIILGVCIALISLIAGAAVIGIVSNREEVPSDTETTNAETSDTADIPSIKPNETESEASVDRPGELTVDVVGANGNNERPKEPTIEGEPFIGDGRKEKETDEVD